MIKRGLAWSSVLAEGLPGTDGEPSKYSSKIDSKNQRNEMEPQCNGACRRSLDPQFYDNASKFAITQDRASRLRSPG